MASLDPTERAKIQLAAGDQVRIVTSGQCTVQGLTGAPEGTTTLTASSQDFGPYGVAAVLLVTCVSGSTDYSLVDEPVLTNSQKASVQQGRVPNRWALFGDSRLAISEPASTSLRSIWNVAQAIGGRRCNLVVNAAIGGEDCAQHLARIDSSLLAYQPSHVVYLGFTNSIATGDGAASAINTMLGPGGIFPRILETGATILACLEYPASNVYNSATYREDLHRCNRALIEYARTQPNVLIVNLFGPIVDAASATGDQRSGLSYDGIHLALSGAKIGGQVLADVIATIQPPRRLLHTSLTDVVSAAYPTGNILTNGCMNGATGTVSGTGMSSSGGVGVATSWAVALELGTATCVASKVARTDGQPGEWQRLTISFGADNSIVKLRQVITLPAQVTAGDTTEALWEMVVSDVVGQVDNVQMHAQWQTSGGSTISATDAYPPAFAEPVVAMAGTYRSPRMVLPATTAKVTWGIRATGDTGASLVLDIGNAELRKVA